MLNEGGKPSSSYLYPLFTTQGNTMAHFKGKKLIAIPVGIAIALVIAAYLVALCVAWVVLTVAIPL
jgi:uncharacterized membrane protein